MGFDRKFFQTAVSTLNTEIDRWPVMIKPECPLAHGHRHSSTKQNKCGFRCIVPMSVIVYKL
jgi:hypothetical protein